MKKLLIISIVLIFTGCGFNITPDEALNADCGPYPHNYKQLIIDYYTPKLIDPTSGIFDFWEPVKGKSSGNYGWKVMTKINGKNRFGGYIGGEYHRFFISYGRISECDHVACAILQRSDK